VILTEYGATAAYHPAWSNTYDFPKNNEEKNGECIPPTGAVGPISRNVAELPTAARSNPNMNGLVDYVTNMASLIYGAYQNGGLLAGGFYFEWNDEWWKADSKNAAYRSEHVGNDKFVAYFPGCGNDAAWFGLNSIKKSAGSLDSITPRPTRPALKKVWSSQQP
jgi:hypothetical protein